MPVNSVLGDETPAAVRTDQLLAAACRVLSRNGTRGLSLRDVAEEADVSKPLIHYYFSSRDDLLVKAYEFADERGRARVRQLLPERGAAVERLAQLLRLYLGQDSEVSQDWIIWTELSGAAIFEAELRPVMVRSFQRWTGWIESLVRDAVLEGALDPDTDTRATALRLIAVVEGIGSLFVRELIERDRAVATLDATLVQELGTGASNDRVAASERTSPSSTYLRQLAALARQAVGGLDLVAENPADSAAVHAVEALIDRAAGVPSHPLPPTAPEVGAP